MFSIIKIAAICAIFFTASAFADSDDGGYERRQHNEYRMGYDQNYGAGYARAMEYSPGQRSFSAPPVNYSASVQPMSIYDRKEMNGRHEQGGRW